MNPLTSFFVLHRFLCVPSHLMRFSLPVIVVVAGLEADKTCHLLQLLVLAATMDPAPNVEEKEPELQSKIMAHDISDMPDKKEPSASETPGNDSLTKGRYQSEAKIEHPVVPEGQNESKLQGSANESLEANQKIETEEETLLDQKELNARFESSAEESSKAAGQKDEKDRPVQMQSNARLEKSVESPTEAESKPDQEPRAMVKFENDSSAVKEGNDGHSGSRKGKEARGQRSSAHRVSVDEAELNMLANEARSQSISLRPTTARRRPPRVKDSGSNPVTSCEDNDADAKPMVILKDGEEDDEPFRLDNTGGDEQDFEAFSQRKKDDANEFKNISTGGRTAIVQKIVNEDAAGKKDEEDEDGRKEAKAGIRLRLNLGKKSTKRSTSSDMVSTDLPTLLELIQGIARSVVPLGKCMDSVQSDLGQMSKERDRWQSACQKNIEALDASKKRVGDALDPLMDKLKSTDEQLQQKRRQIDAIKGRINQNQIWLEKRIMSIAMTTS